MVDSVITSTYFARSLKLTAPSLNLWSENLMNPGLQEAFPVIHRRRAKVARNRLTDIGKRFSKP